VQTFAPIEAKPIKEEPIKKEIKKEDPVSIPAPVKERARNDFEDDFDGLDDLLPSKAVKDEKKSSAAASRVFSEDS
jgi:hypothetical protein